ncbi:MAG TPA: alpha/beta hydrolase [Nocardioidaceae bacterium]|nr:alpha/beta hydrolase [Nocardioidaceae bacterium]
MALPPDPAAVVELPGPWQHKYVAANGARFHVVESLPEGAPRDAPLVLLLHGFPEFWWAWRDLLPVLAAQGYRAVAMDLRGYGGSDKPPRGYDPVTLAGDVAGVVKALGARRAVVVGQGWGGYVGWATAALHPNQVTGLCAVAAPHPRVVLPLMFSEVPGSRKLGMLGHVLAMQAPFVPERRLSRAASSYVRDHLREWSSPGSSFPDEDTARRYQQAISLWPAAHCALEYHRWLVRSRVRADGRRFDALMEPPVTVPVCLVQGADDPVVPVHAGTRSRDHVAAACEEHVVPGTGHFPHEEDPDAFATVLVQWLERLRTT